MKTGDKYLLIFILILAGVVLSTSLFTATSGNSKLVVIKSDGKIIRKIPLRKSQNIAFTVKSKEGHLTVEIADGKVRVLQSTCKDKLCVKEGWISRIGESIICLPNRISITIIGRGGEKIDTTTY